MEEESPSRRENEPYVKLKKDSYWLFFSELDVVNQTFNEKVVELRDASRVT